MTRDELVAELVLERFAPTGHTEHHDVRPAPVYAAAVVVDDGDGPGADVIRLDERRRAA